MDLNSTLEIIIKDLKEAEKIIDDLRNIKGVPVLQIELAKAKCRSAEEIIALLKNYQLIDPEDTGNNIPAPGRTELSAPAAVHATKPKKTEMQAASVQTGKHIQATGEAKQPETEVFRKEPKQGSTILADKYSALGDRLNEKMGTRSDDDISARIKQSRILNLEDALGVNDRFYFIRELYDGDKEAFNNTIILLNSATDLSEAEKIINENLTARSEPAAVKALLDLVKRKIGSDE